MASLFRSRRAPGAALVLLAGLLSACSDAVEPRVATSVEIQGGPVAFTFLGEATTFTATVLDQSGDPLPDAPRSWSTDAPGVATVTPTGMVTAAGNGTARITVTSGSASGWVEVSVAQEPDAVEVTPGAGTLSALMDTLRLSATATDAGGSPIPGVLLTWSVDDTAVVSVDGSGLVTARGNGTATVTASVGGLSDQAAVSVSQAVVTLVLASGPVVLKDPGDTATLVPTLLDAHGAPVSGVPVGWLSRDEEVATVDADGIVTGVGTGTTTVVASAGSYADSVEVTVEPELTLQAAGPTGWTAPVTSSLSLGARVQDLVGNVHPGTTVTWSTPPGSGTIGSATETVSDGSGYVGAVWTLGSAAGGQQAFASLESRGAVVTVTFTATATPGPAVSASLVADSILLSARGETAFLGPTYRDAWGNVTSGSATWNSRDPGVATVAPDGLVTGAGAGSTWVVASLDAPVDSLRVTVEMRGAITLTFDDGWRSVYENAWPVIQEFPWLRANVGVYTEAVGWPAYMTEDHLDELHAAGWSMVSHTVSHDSLTTLSPAELDYELRTSQAWIDARGYRGSHIFVAPYHAFTDAERAAASAYYTAARGASANATVPDTMVAWMPVLPFHLTGIDAEDLPYTTPAGRDRLRDLLQRTRDEGRFLDVYFHQVPPENVDAFRAFLEVLEEFRERVLPYHELYPALARPVY